VGRVERLGGEGTGEISSIRKVGAASMGVMLAAAVQFCLTPLYGALSDRVGRRPVYMFGAAMLALVGFPFLWMLQTAQVPLVWFGFVLAFAAGSYWPVALQLVVVGVISLVSVVLATETFRAEIVEEPAP
jgi:MFS family permease